MRPRSQLPLSVTREELRAVGARRAAPTGRRNRDAASRAPARRGTSSAPKRVRAGLARIEGFDRLRADLDALDRHRRRAAPAPTPGSARARGWPERPSRGQAIVQGNPHRRRQARVDSCEHDLAGDRFTPSAVMLARAFDADARSAPINQECSLRAEPRAAPRGSAAACSSNSSASFSVMAPPSSSASTMVTARR